MWNGTPVGRLDVGIGLKVNLTGTQFLSSMFSGTEQ